MQRNFSSSIESHPQKMEVAKCRLDHIQSIKYSLMSLIKKKHFEFLSYNLLVMSIAVYKLAFANFIARLLVQVFTGVAIRLSPSRYSLVFLSYFNFLFCVCYAMLLFHSRVVFSLQIKALGTGASLCISDFSKTGIPPCVCGKEILATMGIHLSMAQTK